MNFDQDTKIYDRTFSPSKWIPLFLGLGSVVFVGVFIFILHRDGPELPTILGLIFFGLGFVFSLFLSFWFSRKITVGINKNGVFVWKYGVVPWGQIKGFELGKIGFGAHAQKFILISLHDPDSFFSQLPALQRWGRFATKKKVAIVKTNVSVRLEELLQILQSYHRDVIRNH